MVSTITIRDYTPADFESVKAIHAATEIDYKFPDINAPLFLVKKVVEHDGVVRVAAGMYLQAETYLWLDQTDWASPQDKLDAIKELDKEVMHDTWLQGVDCACLWLPPGMERFGERLTEDLGFTRDRDGWVSYSKPTGDKREDLHRN